MLAEAIGYSLPLAVGAALSPLPVAAVITILQSSRPTNGQLFLFGWLAGILAIGLTVFVVPGLDTERGEPTRLSGWVRLLLGGVMLTLAVYQLRKRSSERDLEDQPKVLSKLDTAGPRVAVMSGILLSLNPKNLILVMAGSATIDASMTTPAQQVVALGIFALVASSTVIAPIVACQLFPEWSSSALAALKDWVLDNSAGVLAALLCLFGAFVIWNGLVILAV